MQNILKYFNPANIAQKETIPQTLVLPFTTPLKYETSGDKLDLII